MLAYPLRSRSSSLPMQAQPKTLHQRRETVLRNSLCFDKWESLRSYQVPRNRSRWMVGIGVIVCFTVICSTPKEYKLLSNFHLKKLQLVLPFEALFASPCVTSSTTIKFLEMYPLIFPHSHPPSLLLASPNPTSFLDTLQPSPIPPLEPNPPRLYFLHQPCKRI